MAQKLLLFWRKPARRCWWEGVELEDVEGVPGTLKVWIRRVWTLEMVSYNYVFVKNGAQFADQFPTERHWPPLATESLSNTKGRRSIIFRSLAFPTEAPLFLHSNDRRDDTVPNMQASPMLFSMAVSARLAARLRGLRFCRHVSTADDDDRKPTKES
jgi:hypothetical protein